MLNIGDGMGVLIACENNGWHPWMSFSLWKSLTFYLPKGKVAVSAAAESGDLYNWAKYLKVPVFLCGHEKAKNKDFFSGLDVLQLPPHIVAVREFRDPIGPEDVRTNEIVTFVDFQNGCGSATAEDLKVVVPFQFATKRWKKYNLSLNEKKVLEHWQSINDRYLW